MTAPAPAEPQLMIGAVGAAGAAGSAGAVGRDGAAGAAGQRRRPAAGLARTAGPALLVSAGYVDPGNWGTDVAAGAQAGYRLIWVLAAATLAALFLQQLAARLSLASGRDLAGLMHDRLPGPVRRTVLPLVLGALAITEVVEVFGVVIGVRLLTGASATYSVAIAIVLVLLVVVAPAGIGRRVVYGCLGGIGLLYLGLLLLQGMGDVVLGLHPRPVAGAELPVAIGMIGAVVMPHNLLLHSSLAQQLRAAEPGLDVRRVLRSSGLTTAAALVVAFAVNCAITLLGARIARSGNGDLAATFDRLHTLYGQAAAVLFAFTLLAAGLASSVTGGLVSSDAIARFHPRSTLTPTARRLCCLVPATVLALSGLPVVPVLVWSQVALTLALPLVLVPLLWFTAQPRLMGAHVAGRWTRTVGVAITLTVLATGWWSVLLTVHP